MNLLDRLESRLPWLAVPNVVLFIVAGQALVTVVSMLQKGAIDPLEHVQLLPSRVLDGEWWRLLTFMFQPPQTSLAFQLLTWLALWSLSGALERAWGTIRLNLYLLIGYVATVAVSFFLPDGAATNEYLNTSLFLAFAQIFPDAIVYMWLVYFPVPVRAKWLAALIWLFFGVRVYLGGWPQFWLVMATLADFLLFFGVRALVGFSDYRRKQKFRAMVQQSADRVQHECRVCGLTSVMAPRTSFRYCTLCAGAACYCPEHLKNHEHIST